MAITGHIYTKEKLFQKREYRDCKKAAETRRKYW